MTISHCLVCSNPCDQRPVQENELNLNNKKNGSIQINCTCIYHRVCLLSIVNAQLHATASPSCINCHQWIQIKQEPKTPEEIEKESDINEAQSFGAALLFFHFVGASFLK